MFEQTTLCAAEPASFELAPGIHLIESTLGERVMRQFLLTGDRHSMLIDTGLHSTPLEGIAPYFEKIGLRPESLQYVLISHADFDHQGGNDTARRLFPNAFFLCHHLDQELIGSTNRLVDERYGEFEDEHGITDSAETTAWIQEVCRSETPMDITVDGEASIRLGSNWSIRILHTPGHSKGHVSVWDERGGIAIIADAALWNCLPERSGRPAFPPTYRHLEDYRRTISKLRALGAAHLLTSHFPLRHGADVDLFLSNSMAFTRRFEEYLESELAGASRALSTRELIGRLSPRLGEWPEAAAVYLVYPLIGHLEDLERMGKVRRDYVGQLAQWSRVNAQ